MNPNQSDNDDMDRKPPAKKRNADVIDLTNLADSPDRRDNVNRDNVNREDDILVVDGLAQGGINELSYNEPNHEAWFDDVVVKSMYGNEPRTLFSDDKFNLIQNLNDALKRGHKEHTRPSACGEFKKFDALARSSDGWVNLSELAHLQVETHRNGSVKIIATNTVDNKLRVYREGRGSKKNLMVLNPMDDHSASVGRFVCIFPGSNFTIMIWVRGNFTLPQYHMVPLKPSDWNYPERQGSTVEQFIANFMTGQFIANLDGTSVAMGLCQVFTFRVVEVKIFRNHTENETASNKKRWVVKADHPFSDPVEEDKKEDSRGSN